MTSYNDQIEEALRDNLHFRRQLMTEIVKAGEPVTLGQKIRKWWRFGKAEDQPIISALLLILISIALYFIF